MFSLMNAVLVASSTEEVSPPPPALNTCFDIKLAYQSSSCCSSDLARVTNYTIAPPPPPPMAGINECAGTKPTATSFDNRPCVVSGVINALEQSGTNVTVGYTGLVNSSDPSRGVNANSVPVTVPFYQAGLCPVNVHFHLGTEHLSVGEFDEKGSGPSISRTSVRKGFQCHHYNSADAKFTTPYNWQHCKDMVIGETYEIHWPHSKAGACGKPSQYQTAFYDGVFCNWPNVGGGAVAANTWENIGVQSQVFTIVNDEAFYYPDLFRGMLVDAAYGSDISYYTGATTGTSRSNTICSAYTPITWQVDRKCGIISASSFDKMCADMKSQRDDMTGDLGPHGARELVADFIASDNHQSATAIYG